MTDEAKISFIRQAGQLITRLTITGAVAISAIGAVILGQGLLSERAAAIPQPPAAQATPVQVQIVEHVSTYRTQRAFLGQVEPRSSVDISFELSGLVTELQVSEGAHVTKGDVIAKLDTALLEAEKDRLEALRSATQSQLDFAQTRVDRANNLQKRGFTSIETRDQAMAIRDELTNRIAETSAALASVEINLSKSTLYAPISGQVAAQAVDIAETVTAGQTVAVLLETAHPEFRVGLPLSLDTRPLVDAIVTIGNKSVHAELIQLRPDVEPVTRTRTALFRLPEQMPFVFGQTGTLSLSLDTDATGFWVALDALKQGEGSVWTVLTVDDENAVRPAAVEIVHAEQDRAFVRGSVQDGDRLIISGAHRVVPGQTVSVSNAGN